MDAQGLLIARLLEAKARDHALAAARRHEERQPHVAGLLERIDFGTAVDDHELRVRNLAAALAAGRSALFASHVQWLKVALAAREAPGDYVAQGLDCLREELAARLPSALAPMALGYVDEGRAALDRAAEPESALRDDLPLADVARDYFAFVLANRPDDALARLARAIDAGTGVPDLYRHVLSRAQAEIGRAWQLNRAHVAQEHLATFVAEQAMAMLKARARTARPVGKRALATAVEGNRHAIGLRMVADCFAMAGWDAIQLGADTPLRSLVRALADLRPDVLLLSAQRAVDVRPAADLIDMLREEEATSRIRVLVGGPPFTTVPDLWNVVGAHGHAADGPSAVEVATRLVA